MSNLPHNQPDEPAPANETPETGEVVLTAPNRQKALCWMAALASAQFDYRVESRQGRTRIFVPQESAEAARREIELYEQVNKDWPPPELLERPPLPNSDFAWSGATFFSFVILLVFAWYGPYTGRIPVYAAAAADSAEIARGEWWRLYTALFLHGDWGHVLSNTVAGFFLVQAAVDILGVGVAWTAMLTAAGAANAAAAVSSSGPRTAIGASTLVFSALGALVGAQFVRHWKAHRSLRYWWHRSWIAAGAGLGLLAFLGSSQNSDVAAHFYGFLFGAAAGGAAALMNPSRFSHRLQYALHGVCVILLVVCWVLALATLR